jgi:hypothetical protein
MTERALSHAITRADAQVAARAGICASLLGAAIIHGSVMPEHWVAWAPAGVFFLGTELVEASLAIAAVYAWQRRVAQLVFLSSLATVLVWMISRTTGMPFGPAAFRVPEAVGAPDVASCLLELGAAALAAPLAFAAVRPAQAFRSAKAQRRAARKAASAPTATVGRSGRFLAGALALIAAGVMLWGLSPHLSAIGDPGGPAAHQHGHAAP